MRSVELALIYEDIIDSHEFGHAHEGMIGGSPGSDSGNRKARDMEIPGYVWMLFMDYPLNLANNSRGQACPCNFFFVCLLFQLQDRIAITPLKRTVDGGKSWEVLFESERAEKSNVVNVEIVR